MAFTLMGYTVKNAEQARSVLVVACLTGNESVKAQAISIINQYENKVKP
jgi:hypothetical protein